MNNDQLRDFPTRRIEPVDGMAVTAKVWEEAHSYHRQRLQFHELLEHGAGIVTGLSVIASDPPDSAVYILPGVAIDPEGQPIIMDEPVTYDIGGSAEGLLYLLLSYGESRPRAVGDRPDSPLYVHTEFGIEARSSLPDTPCVELARIRRQSRESPIFNAQDKAHPGPNEIDLRFRHEIRARPRQMLSMAVSYVGGGMKDVRHGRGADLMARAFGRAHRDKVARSLSVDHNIPLNGDLKPYALLYLVGQGSFQLSKMEMETLYNYMQNGGTVFIESCRRETGSESAPGGDPPADTSFYNLLADLGVELNELRSDHRMLREPFLFAAPPQGFETQGTPRVAVSDSVIFSTYDYGCLWQGERRSGSASREAIRAALEWGANIVTYAAERKDRMANDE
jgi:hypothetical protein